jgi:hypothetical protein
MADFICSLDEVEANYIMYIDVIISADYIY